MAMPPITGPATELNAQYQAALNYLEGAIGTPAPLTTKGDLFGYSTVNARVPIGTNGQVLTADSTQALGLKWDNPPGGGDALTASPLSQFAATTSAQLRSVLSDENGTGAALFDNATSVNLITPTLGVASATSINKLTITAPATSATLTIADGKTFTVNNTLTLTATDGSTLAIGAGGTLGSAAYTSASVYGLVGSPLSQFASTTSAQLRGVLSDELGTGAALFDGATPTSFVLTNATGLPVSTGISGLGSGVATFLATPSSANLAAAVTGETGSGALVFGTSPSFTTDITSPVYKGIGTVASTGDIRLATNFQLNARNGANTADIGMLAVDSNDEAYLAIGAAHVTTVPLQIGNYIPSAPNLIGINVRMITLTNQTTYGAYITARDETGAGTTPLLIGVQGEADTANSSGTVTNAAAVAGYLNIHNAASFGTGFGLYSTVVVTTSTVTASVSGVRSELLLANTNTIPSARIFRGTAAVSTGTVTELRGLDLSDWTASSTVTTSYGIYMDSSIDIGTTKYAIYSLSASPSVLSGNLTISNTAPSLILTDTTASAKSLTIAVDANLANLRESAGASGSLLLLDLANNRVGIREAAPDYPLHLTSSGVAFQMECTATQDIFQSMGPDPVSGPAFNFGYSGSSFGRGSGFFNARPDASATGLNPSIRFLTANVARMAITNAGNIKIAGTAVRATTEGTNHLDIFDGTAPVGTLAAGCSIFSASGKLKSMDAAGTAGHVVSASAVNSVSPTAPNRTLTVDIAGTTYYIAAKTTND